ncbi:MAG: class I SAM-dependent methyltransferase [Patescibacteria group bacterium]|jgi:ubiquinone/menaquinone biosynthesis C-methylase UbiE
MDDSEKKFQETLNVYRRIGAKYIEDIADIIVEEREEFEKRLAPGSHILDIGCAGGRDSAYFIAHGHRVTGIDLVEEFIDEARKRVPKGDFLTMDARKLSFADASFNAIWANAVLLHLEKDDRKKVLRECFRVMLAGGLLHVRMKEGQGSDTKSDALSSGENRFFSYITQEELEAELQEAGFTIERSERYEDELGRKGVDWISIWGKKSE